MNEQLENTLVEILTKAANTADQAAYFIVAETPEVVQQVLMFYSIKYAFITMFGLVLLLTSALLLRPKYWVKGVYLNERGNDFSAKGGIASISSLFMLINGGICFFDTVFDFIKITASPKLWLIEYAASFVK